MATQQQTINYLLEQCAAAGSITAKRMFGEYGFYCDGKVVALVCDDQFFLKSTDAARSFLGKAEEGIPFPGAKPWLLISGEQWEDAEWMATLVRITADALPMPKPKTGKSRSRHAE